jgi:trimeric autotransporter adhesin
MAGNNTAGNGLNQLRYPWGLYVDSNYTIYVVDRGNHRIQKWEQGLLYLYFA